MEEIWKDIDNYDGYQVSNLGRVRTHNKITYTKKHGTRHWKDRILHYKPSTTSGQRSNQGMGYRVDLWKNGKPKTLLVARLVLATFTNTDIHTKLTVNHKDGNRLNNNIDNLEWLSREDNIRYGFENNQYRNICNRCTLTRKDERYEFQSYRKASEFLLRNKHYISNRVHKGYKTALDINNNRYLIETL